MQQDYTITLDPGKAEWVSIGLVEFLFIKAADRPVEVVIDNFTMLMDVNQKTRPAQPFDGFTMKNPDPINPATITFVAGLGDYTTQSIKGQLNVVPSIIKSDGTVASDTRFFIDLTIKPDQKFETLSVLAGEIKTRQLLFNGNNSEDAPCSGPFNDGVFIGRNEVSSGGSGWGVDLAYYGLDGSLREIRRLAFRYVARFGTPKEFTPLDDTFFFMLQDDGANHMISLCSWQNGAATVHSDPRYTVATGQAEASASGGGIEYNPATGKLMFAYANPADLTQIIIETLSWNAGVGTLTLDSQQIIQGPETTNGVQSLATINGELLLVTKRTFSSDPHVIRVSDGSEIWLTTLSEITTTQSVIRLFQIGDSVYSVEGYNSAYSQYLAERYPRDANFNFKGRVEERDQACYSGIFKPEPGLLSEASVEAINITGNRFRVSGEVIKVALNLFFQGDIAPDYLDAIYGIEIADTATIPKIYRFYSGNESFKRLGITDDFQIEAPGTLRLFVDASFWSVKV